MYFWNALSATTHFSQSISHFASLLRNLRFCFYWGKYFLNSLNQVLRKWMQGLWCFCVTLGPMVAAFPPPALTQAGIFEISLPVPFCTVRHPFLLCVREVGNSALPAFPSSRSLDFNIRSSLAEEGGRSTELSKHLTSTRRGFMDSVNRSRNHLRKWPDPDMAWLCEMAFSPVCNWPQGHSCSGSLRTPERASVFVS